jgi:hypothetical protein
VVVSGWEWLGLYNSLKYLAVSKRFLVLPRDAKMTKLLLATVCVIALTIGAQAKPVRLGLIDNKWVIEYDSELFAGACIATTGYDLLKLKISFITAYPKEGEGTEKLWFLGLSSPEWTWIRSSTTYDFAIDTQRKGDETKKWSLVFTGGQTDLCLQK